MNKKIFLTVFLAAIVFSSGCTQQETTDNGSQLQTGNNDIATPPQNNGPLSPSNGFEGKNFQKQCNTDEDCKIQQGQKMPARDFNSQRDFNQMTDFNRPAGFNRQGDFNQNGSDRRMSDFNGQRPEGNLKCIEGYCSFVPVEK